MEQRKDRHAIIDKAIMISSGLFGLFFLGVSCYFQLKAYLLGDPIIFNDLWITTLLFVGICIWHIPSTKDKHKPKYK